MYKYDYFNRSPRNLFRHHSSRTYSPQFDLDEPFKFINYENWKVGMNVQCKKNGNVIEMGTLMKKSLIGSHRDPDMVLTFSQNGVNTVHMVDFTATYRQY